MISTYYCTIVIVIKLPCAGRKGYRQKYVAGLYVKPKYTYLYLRFLRAYKNRKRCNLILRTPLKRYVIKHHGHRNTTETHT